MFFYFVEVLAVYTVLNLQYDMRKISRESVFEVIAFRLWVYELLAVLYGDPPNDLYIFH